MKTMKWNIIRLLLLSVGWMPLAEAKASLQLLTMASNTAASTTVTQFAPLMGYATTWNATEVNHRAPAPFPGTLLGFRCQADTNPGAAKTYALTVMKNGAATTLVCTLTNATLAQDLTDTVSIVAGDTLSIRCVPTGTPKASVLHWSLLFRPTTSGNSMYLGLNNTLGGTKTYVAFWAKQVNATEGNVLAPVALGGTFNKLYIECNNAAGSGKTLTMTFRRAVAGSTTGVATAFKTTISGASQVTNNDTTDTITATAGEVVAMEEDNSGAGNATNKCRYGVGFTATLPGAFLQFASNGGNAASTSATNYIALDAGGLTPDTVEANVKTLMQLSLMNSIYAQSSAAPGGSASYTMTVRDNGTSKAVTCAISGTATTCNALLTDVPFVNDDQANYSIVPTSTPTAAAIAAGLGMVINPRRTVLLQ